MKDFNKIWKTLAATKQLTPHNFVERALLIATKSKNNASPKEDIVVALLQKYFSPVTNANKLQNGYKKYHYVQSFSQFANSYLKHSTLGKLTHSFESSKGMFWCSILGANPSEIFDSEEEFEIYRTLALSIKDYKLGRKYVYYFTRQDIPSVHQAVQAGHALFGLAKLDKSKIDPSEVYFQWIGVEDEKKLYDVITTHKKHQYFAFYEPDLGNTLTSVAFSPILWNKRQEFTDYSLLSMEH